MTRTPTFHQAKGSRATEAYQLLKIEKLSASEATKELIKRGFDPAAATSAVNIAEQYIQALKEKATIDMNKGFYWLAGGFIVSGITYLIANITGIYVVAWGAMAYGLFLIIRGLANR